MSPVMSFDQFSVPAGVPSCGAGLKSNERVIVFPQEVKSRLYCSGVQGLPGRLAYCGIWSSLMDETIGDFSSLVACVAHFSV